MRERREREKGERELKRRWSDRIGRQRVDKGDILTYQVDTIWCYPYYSEWLSSIRDSE